MPREEAGQGLGAGRFPCGPGRSRSAPLSFSQALGPPEAPLLSSLLSFLLSSLLHFSPSSSYKTRYTFPGRPSHPPLPRGQGPFLRHQPSLTFRGQHRQPVCLYVSPSDVSFTHACVRASLAEGLLYASKSGGDGDRPDSWSRQGAHRPEGVETSGAVTRWQMF